MDPCLGSCRSCCKFEQGDGYFAPRMTAEEIERLRAHGAFKDVFVPYKGVFQVQAVPSRLSKGLLVCPFLDEDSHRCDIHGIKPFDCAFWPFMVAREKDGRLVIAHFDKDVCPKTESMTEEAFKAYLGRGLDAWMEKGLLRMIEEHPGLVWDREDYTFVVRELRPRRSALRA